MKLNSIVTKTNFRRMTPISIADLIKTTTDSIDLIIVSLVTANIKVTTGMFEMAAEGDLLGMLKLIPNMTEKMAADIIDGSMIGFNLQEGLYDEAIEAVKELKEDVLIRNDNNE